MAKKKTRSVVSRRAEHPNKTGAAAGVYPISTGEAELVPDGYHADGWLLLINGVQSSHVIVGQPRMLDFEYMRWIAAVLDLHIQIHLNPEKLRITHLGGGACSLARYCADVYPNSRNTVVELDAKLAEHVRDWFDIPKSPRVKIRVGDAGTVTRSFAPASRDVVIRDVFAVDKTPVNLRVWISCGRLITLWGPVDCIFSTAAMTARLMPPAPKPPPCLRCLNT